MTKGSDMGGVLSRNDIIEYLEADKLVITPILDREMQIHGSSFDVRLGNELVLMKQTKLSNLDIKDHDQLKFKIREFQERVKIQYGQSITVHPQQFILSNTLEYVAFPLDLMAYVVGRSSWGRLGLIIATATLVDAGFKGTITLEIVNLGDVPITLYPGVRIAQLVFHKLTRPVDKGYVESRGKYGLNVSPKFSEIYKDEEIDLLVRKSDAP